MTNMTPEILTLEEFARTSGGQVEDKAIGLLEACRQHSLVGLVIVIDSTGELTLVGNGITRENVQTVLRCVLNGTMSGDVETELELDLRPGAAQA
jgi:hypothetical protein